MSNLKREVERLTLRLAELAARKEEEQSRWSSSDELRLQTVGRQLGQASALYHVLTDADSLRVGDLMLGVGGATAWANALVRSYCAPDEHDLAHVERLKALGFSLLPQERGSPLWGMAPDDEIEFLRTWLVEADQSGREVWNREGIEKWIAFLGGKPTRKAEQATPAPVPEPYSAPATDYDEVVAQRARQRESDGWSEALRPSDPPTPDEIQDALIRRRNRQSTGRRK